MIFPSLLYAVRGSTKKNKAQKNRAVEIKEKERKKFNNQNQINCKRPTATTPITDGEEHVQKILTIIKIFIQ